jgi:hypothetical protein
MSDFRAQNPSPKCGVNIRKDCYESVNAVARSCPDIALKFRDGAVLRNWISAFSAFL